MSSENYLKAPIFAATNLCILRFLHLAKIICYSNFYSQNLPYFEVQATMADDTGR